MAVGKEQTELNTVPMAERIESDAAASVATMSQVFDRYESELLAYALKLVKNRPVAEDLVQDAFLRLHPLFDSVENPRAWLYRTTHNLAVNYHRSNRRTVSMEEREEAGGDAETPVDANLPLPDEYLQRMEAIGRMRICLEGLDERSREVVRLKFEESFSYKEISKKTGLSVSNVGYILHHALKRLGREMKESGTL